MKVLHSIAYLMLPIAIINNDSYTTDNKGETPGNFNTIQEKELYNQNLLISHIKQYNNKLFQNNVNLLQNYNNIINNQLNICKNCDDDNNDNEQNIENLLDINSYLNKLRDILEINSYKLFEKYALINCNDLINIDNKKGKLFIINPNNKTEITCKIKQVFDDQDNEIDISIKNGKIYFQNENQLSKQFEELKNKYNNGYYSFLKCNDRYYLTYTVPQNGYSNDIYILSHDGNKEKFKIEKFPHPSAKQYYYLNCNATSYHVKDQYKDYEFYTLPDNTTVYVHEYLGNPQSELVNIMDNLYEKYNLNDKESIGILKDDQYYYLVIYSIDENNKLCLRDINNKCKMKFILDNSANIQFKYEEENNNNEDNKYEILEENGNREEYLDNEQNEIKYDEVNENEKDIKNYADNNEINENNNNENSNGKIVEEENQEEYSYDEQNEQKDEYYKEEDYNNNQIKINKQNVKEDKNEIIINKIQDKQQQNTNNNEQILKTKEQLNENISILFTMIDEHQESEENKELINSPIKDEDQLKQIILNEDFINTINNKSKRYDYLVKKGYGFLGNAEFMDLIQQIIPQYNEIQHVNKYENYNYKMNKEEVKHKNGIIINNDKYNNKHIEENKIIENKNQNLQLQQQNKIIKLENKLKSIKQEINNKEQEIVNQYNAIKQKWDNNQEEQEKFIEHFSDLITSKKFLQKITLNDQNNNVNEFINKYFKDKKYKIPEKYYQKIYKIAKLNNEINEWKKNNTNASKDDQREIDVLNNTLANNYSKLIQKLSSDKNHIKHPDYLYQLITSRELSNKLIRIITQDKQNNDELNNILFKYFTENNYLVPQKYYKQIYEIAKLNLIVQNLKIEAENIKNKLIQK